jgi:hypothetical protein
MASGAASLAEDAAEGDPQRQQRQLVAVLQPAERQLCVDWSQLSTGACSARLAEELSPEERSAAAADCAAVAAVLFRRLAVERQQAVRRADGEWESAVEHVMPRIVRTILHSVLAVLRLEEGDYLDQAAATLVGSGAAPPPPAQLQPAQSRWLLVWVLLVVFTSGGRYDARMRAFLRALCRLYEIPFLKLLAAEALRLEGLAQLLQHRGSSPGYDARDDKSAEGSSHNAASSDASWSTGRTLKVGGAALAGSAALFMSGGAAAPALGGAFGAVGAGNALAAAGGAQALFGAAGAGMSAVAVKNLTGGVQEFAVDPPKCNHVEQRQPPPPERSACEPEPEPEPGSGSGLHDGEPVEDKAGLLESLRQSGEISDAELTALLAVFAKEQAEDDTVDCSVPTAPAASEHSTTPAPAATPERKSSSAPTDAGAGAGVANPTNGLGVVIGVSGWLSADDGDGESEGDSFEAQWSWLSEELPGHECNWVRWESDTLRELGQQFRNFIKSKVHQNIGYTVAQEVTIGMEMLEFAVVEAFAWPVVLLTAATYIDNAWSMACSRAVKAGRMLAATLLARSYGHRPVTLCGYSTGALLIWSCLKELAEAPDGAGEGIVESAFLLGAPVTASTQSWIKVRKVVAGRLVNGYNRGDWVLWMLQRSIGGALVGEIAGLSPVTADIGVESVDVSLLLLEEKRQGHGQYRSKFRRVFEALGLGGDSCELLWALKRRRAEAEGELAKTAERIAALEQEQARRRERERSNLAENK